MLLKKEREEIVKYCREMINTGLTKGTGGNISILNREENILAISTSGQNYFEMTPKDVPVIDSLGNIIEGNKKPSSELMMHTMIYKYFPHVNAIVHCHSTYATALSILREDLPASNYLLATGGGNNIRCSEYASFGTEEIAQKVVDALKDRNACLLANHGQIACSNNVKKAFSIASTVEECAQTYMIARSCGKPYILSDEEMEFMVEKFKTYGR